MSCEVIGKKRDYGVSRIEVKSMRGQIRQTPDSKPAGVFDLKSVKGGIADIEFIVQFKFYRRQMNIGSCSNYPIRFGS